MIDKSNGDFIESSYKPTKRLLKYKNPLFLLSKRKL
jgi:hypothetical protein